MRKLPLLILGIAVAVAWGCVLSYQQKDQRHLAFDVSPDSRRVVFNSSGEGSNGLYTLDLLTMLTRRVQGLVQSRSWEAAPTFSPDGRSLVFAEASGEAEAARLYTYSLAGKTRTRLTDTAGTCDDMPSFSADGRQIVFARALRHRPYSMGGWTWDHWDIYVMRSDGTGLHRLTAQQYYQVSPPKFASDGKTVLFAADHDDSGVLQTDVFAVNSASGGAPKPLTEDGHSSQPAFTPDGNHIVYVSYTNTSSDYFDYELWSMDADGKHPAQLTHEHSYLAYPVVTRDGKHILALSDKSRSVRYDLYEFDIGGQHPRRLADSRLFDDPLRWKPKL